MAINKLLDEAIGNIENYSIKQKCPPLTVSFAEGDTYLCTYETGEWNPGEDTRNLPGFEEWYILYLNVESIITPGPNKDPRYDCIIISCKHMPCLVKAGDEILYQEN